MTVDVREVATVSELVNESLNIHSSLDEGGLLWFRGLNCSSLELVPKLMRAEASVEELFDRERRLITRFRQRSLAFWPSGYPQTDWEHLFAMQHYGVPTRLLDWTENLLVGAYFAVIEPGVPDGHGHEAGCVPAVWCFDPARWNQNVPHLSELGSIGILTTGEQELAAYEPESHSQRLRKRYTSPVALHGTHNTDRIVAQRGTFTLAGNSKQGMEQIAENHEGVVTLWRIDLSGDPAGYLSDLRAIGMTESMVFPDLAGLARELDALET